VLQKNWQPPAWRSDAHVLHDSSGHAPLGKGYSRGGAHQENAAMVHGSQLRPLQNERELTEAKINSIVSWADNGAPEGDTKDKPALVTFLEEWNIKPDVVIEMPDEFQVPATGTVEYQYIVIPSGLTKDPWVTSAEVRPGNRAVMHHGIAFIRPPGSNYWKDAKPDIRFVPGIPERDANGAVVRRVQTERGNADPQRGNGAGGGGIFGTEFLVGYAPGLQEQRFSAAAPGAAKMIPAGSDIIFQFHYTTNRKPAIDKTKIGLTLATEQTKYRYITGNAATQALEIPPNDPNYESHSAVTINEPAQLGWLMPHMHVRGRISLQGSLSHRRD